VLDLEAKQSNGTKGAKAAVKSLLDKNDMEKSVLAALTKGAPPKAHPLSAREPAVSSSSLGILFGVRRTRGPSQATRRRHGRPRRWQRWSSRRRRSVRKS
jgi:hypothetical protein